MRVVFAPPKPIIKPPQRPPAAPGRVLWVEKGKRIGSGQCVALARSYGFKINGNARDWGKNAKVAGYPVDNSPKVGSVVVTRESSAGTNTGHVAIVEKIEDGYIYVVEQNYIRLTVSHGRIPLGSPLIVAFIHKS